MKLDVSQGGRPWVGYSHLDRRNGYLAFGPVGMPFNRRKPLHWVIAIVELWRKGRRPE